MSDAMIRPMHATARRALLCAVFAVSGLVACQPGPAPSPRPTVSPAAVSTATPAPSPTTGAPEPTPAAGDRPRIVIDTDVAPDDLIALASILRDPSVEILAITVSGTGE